MLTIARDVDNIIVKARPIHNLPSSLLSSLFALMAGMKHGQDILTHRGWDNESASIKNQAIVNGELVAEGPVLVEGGLQLVFGIRKSSMHCFEQQLCFAVHVRGRANSVQA